jgi:isopenicillin-N N-acyltransferase-like protein
VVRAKRAASANYVIASADGRGVNLETGPGGAETVFVVHPTDDLLAHANNFTCAIPFGDVAASVWVDSATRVETMADHLHERHGSLTRETATELLTGHTGHPDSICRHSNEKKHEVERSSTIGSWVVDLTEGLASVCFGNPCSGEFTTFAPDLGAFRVSGPGSITEPKNARNQTLRKPATTRRICSDGRLTARDIQDILIMWPRFSSR